MCEWSLRFPCFWRGQFLAYVTMVSPPSVPRRVLPCLKIAKTLRPFVNFSILLGSLLALPLAGITSCLFLAPLPSSMLLQKYGKRLDHSSKKFSGLRLARSEAQHAVSIVFYHANWPSASKTPSFYYVFLRVPRGPREAPHQEAKPATCHRAPRAPPRGKTCHMSSRPPRDGMHLYMHTCPARRNARSD